MIFFVIIISEFELLQYIAGYIRRSVIALGRIEEYGGEYVTFKYVDKTNGKEK
ncbi:transposase [Metabacillus dongyingensis]